MHVDGISGARLCFSVMIPTHVGTVEVFMPLPKPVIHLDEMS